MRGKRRLATIGVGSVACIGLAVGGPALGGQEFGPWLMPQQDEFEEVVFTEPESFEFVVPEDVCDMFVLATGAEGGAGDDGGDQDPPPQGGLGGGIITLIEVTPGETLQVNVGGQGEDGDGADGGDGGFNGGAPGGDGNEDGPGGGGGGGASDVRVDPFLLEDRVVVAGGGGGGGGAFTDNVTPPDGAGGGGSGEDGEDGEDGDFVPAEGGGGGTQTAGGAGGAGALAGSPGSEGDGGDGGNATFPDHPGGGGGGGGLFGGGGGGASEANVSGGGGGGSGFGPPDSDTFTGVREGDGIVILAFEEDPGCDTERAIPARPVAAEPRLTG